MIKERQVMVFHAPKELYEQTKDISSEEMVSISSLCRNTLKHLVTDYQNSRKVSSKLDENSIVGR